jgi:quercetin dioxygenase-like cupin family protein
MHRFLVTILVLAAVPALAEQAVHTESRDHVIVLASELAWTDVASLPPGATVAVIEGNPSAPEPFTMRLRFPANYVIPAHTHPTTERVTVLSGTLHLAAGGELTRDAARALTPGSVTVMPPGMKMWGYTNDPVEVQLHGIGPWGIVYLNPEEDPRKAN